MIDECVLFDQENGAGTQPFAPVLAPVKGVVRTLPKGLVGRIGPARTRDDSTFVDVGISGITQEKFPFFTLLRLQGA